MTLRETLAAATSRYTPDPRTLDDRLSSLLGTASSVTRTGIGYDGRTLRSRVRVDTDRPPRGALSKYRLQFETNAIVRASILSQALGVTADGWRVTADSQETQKFLTKWGRECAIVAGEPADALELVEQISVGMDVEGELPVEHVPAAERDVTIALKPIPPKTLSYKTRPGQALLLRPGDTRYNTPTTDSNEAAAYVQNEGQRGRERPLSLDNVTRFVRDPQPGSVRGVSAIESVSERADAIEEKFADADRAIKAIAYGLYFAGFEPTKLRTEGGGEELVDEWMGDAMDEFDDAVEGLAPGDVISHDGRINLQELAPGAPEIEGQLEQEIAYVIAGLPAPRYEVGWEKSINQFVTERQENSWKSQIQQRRRYIAQRLSVPFAAVAREHGYDDSGVTFLLEPSDDESPVRSLTVEQSEVMLNVARSINEISGTRDPATMVEEGSLLDLVLQLPDDARVEGFAEMEAAVDEEAEA